MEYHRTRLFHIEYLLQAIGIMTTSNEFQQCAFMVIFSQISQKNFDGARTPSNFVYEISNHPVHINFISEGLIILQGF